jgi:hypothetical protein
VAPSVRELVMNQASGASATVTTGSGTTVNDLLVTFYGGDYYLLSQMGNPSGTAGTWTLRTTGDAGTDQPHIKVYTRPVTVGGAQTVTVPALLDAEVYVACYVVQGTGVAFDDAVGSGTATASASVVAPGVTATGTDDLLLSAWQLAGTGQADFSGTPSGMTNMTEVENVFATMGTARQLLVASGATGTRTATISGARSYAAASIALKTSSLPSAKFVGWGVPMK